MKRLIFILLLFLSCNLSYSQMDTLRFYPDEEYNDMGIITKDSDCEKQTLGMGLITSGSLLMLLGVATPVYPANTPFFQQSVRMLAILSGGGLMLSGFIVLIVSSPL